MPWKGLGAILGGTWSLLETLWGHIGSSWEALGRFWEGLGCFQGPFWKHFSMIFAFLKQFMKLVKNLGKPLVFH